MSDTEEHSTEQSFHLILQKSSASKIASAQQLISRGMEMVSRGQKLMAEAWSDLHLLPTGATNSSSIPAAAQAVEIIDLAAAVPAIIVDEETGMDALKTPKRKRAKITDPAEKELMAKRRMSGYLLFCQEVRNSATLNEECPDTKQRMAFIAEKWKNLNGETKKAFEERAEKIRSDAQHETAVNHTVVPEVSSSTSSSSYAVEAQGGAEENVENIPPPKTPATFNNPDQPAPTPMLLDSAVVKVAVEDTTATTTTKTNSIPSSEKKLSKKEKKHKHHQHEEGSGSVDGAAAKKEKKHKKEKKSLGTAGESVSSSAVV